jgi:hypothetical protein
MFSKYTHKGTWNESLHIFLFSKIILQNNDGSKISIEHYHQFELKDTDIITFNKWIDEGCSSSELIHQWMSENETQVTEFTNSFGVGFKPKVELWSDRSKTDYYKEKLQGSFEFESFLSDFFKEKYDLDLGQYLTPEGQYNEGENELGIEIKNDTLIKKYGNIYVEYAEKSKASNQMYVPSGILKDDKTKYFLFGDKDAFWIFRKERLVEIYHEEEALRKENKPSVRGIKFKVIATSMGYVYPVKNAQKEAISLEVLVSEIKSNK